VSSLFTALISICYNVSPVMLADTLWAIDNLSVFISDKALPMLKPAYRLLLLYDTRPDRLQQYYQYMRGEFVPGLQKMGLHMVFAWQIYGDGYPNRQIDFICESGELLRDLLTSERYEEIESRLISYTTSYERKVVRFENRFQF
jgi:hypothetical protein